jgi:hypothetical protein
MLSGSDEDIDQFAPPPDYLRRTEAAEYITTYYGMRCTTKKLRMWATLGRYGVCLESKQIFNPTPKPAGFRGPRQNHVYIRVYTRGWIDDFMTQSFPGVKKWKPSTLPPKWIP